MGFIGKLNLGGTVKNNSFDIESTKRPFYKHNKEIYLEGAITDIFSDSYNLDDYKNKQEQLVIELYEKLGEEFIKLLDGYFLIILEDKSSKTFYIFNNRYSNTFCYYTILDDKLILADKIKPLLKIKGKPEPDIGIINLFLNCGYTFSEKTPFKGICRMVPGQYMKCSNENIEYKKYGYMTFNRKPIKNLKKSLEKYERLWQSAIGNYIKYNKSRNVGSTMSGGHDTSWVVLMASKVHKRPIHSFTCYYQYKLFNEINKATYVTNRCNGIQHNVLVTHKDLDLLPEMIRAAEEPVLASSVSIYKLVKEASKEIDTLFTGDGGDNIYDHYYPVSEIHRFIRFVPYFIRKPLYKFVDFLAEKTGLERLWELKYALHPFSYKNFYDNFYKNLVSYRHFNPKQRENLLKKEFRKELNEKDMIDFIPIKRKSFNNDLLQNNFTHGNMEYVSTFHEKFVKGYGMILFPPYQNQKIMDFICSLPFQYIHKGNVFRRLTNKAIKRYFQKLALRRHFPKSFVDNVEQSFDQPFHGWFEQRPEIVKLLFKRLKKRGWYNHKYLDKLYKEHKKQYQHKKLYCQLQNHGYRIMALLALEIWCTEFLDKDPNKQDKKIVPLEEYLAQDL